MVWAAESPLYSNRYGLPYYWRPSKTDFTNGDESVFQLIRQMVDTDTEPQIVYECRRCGTNLQTPNAACPYCGPTDVARYVI